MASCWQRLYLRHLAASSAPILCGPWRSEVGFHALYFQPWLSAWRARHAVDADRLTVVAPGGSAVWHHPCQIVELFDHVPMAALRRGMIADSVQTGSVKQNGQSEADTALLAFIAESRSLRRYHVLHPSLMYQELAPWFAGKMSLATVINLLTIQEKGGRRCAPMSVPILPMEIVLPEKYLAVKFYGRPTFPLREDLRDWVETFIEKLSEKIPLVLLNSGIEADDHQDFPIATSERVVSVAKWCTPQNNLGVQSAILAKAKGFVGTYGGMQQLALRLGIPSVGFYSEFKHTCYAHKLLTEYLAVQQGTPLWIGRPADASFVSQALGGL